MDEYLKPKYFCKSICLKMTSFFFLTESGKTGASSKISSRDVLRHMCDSKKFTVQKAHYHPKYNDGKTEKTLFSPREALNFLSTPAGNLMCVFYSNGYSNFYLCRLDDKYYHIETFCSAIEEISLVKGDFDG